jgi:undecaprenyl-diphosphatase
VGTLVWMAVALGIVEGVTEFVPVSSTGHLILTGSWLAFPPEKAPAFEIFIQLGAVLAVVWFYRERVGALVRDVWRDPAAQAFAGKLLVAFLPAAIVGLLLHHWIVRVLFGPLPVAIGLAAGGVVLLLVDGPNRSAGRTTSVDDVTWGQALLIGCAQAASLWPGVSRSGATIIGALVAGLVRPAALEFSFFLAMPTLGAASVFALWEARHALVASDVPIFAVGLVTSFVVSLAVIAVLLRYVRDHDLRIFGWYRIVLALVVVAAATLR